MDIRTQLCFSLSRKLMRPPAERTIDYGAYGDWRNDSLSKSWAAFSDTNVTDKDVLDFGCGDGHLSFFLAKEKRPRRIVGVDINEMAIERANETLAQTPYANDMSIEFLVGNTDKLPVPDQSFDTVLAFDCMEHVMSPKSILNDWYRVLRPGGRCLIEWFPYKGPWGPHMEALIPIPWAHIVFGERAMFRTAEKIYDLSEFTPRHWDLDENGKKKPNKWSAWSTFEEQGYINKLDIPTFQTLARGAGFALSRKEQHSFGGSHVRRAIGRTLMNTPLIGEYFVSYVIIELLRPERL
ncbi:Methyltransferase domain-containing protein [Nitrosomonas sp. Nm51]|uniref:class I SAM-dependent methyltransferase n=1 Tax=Nitrosomonas sp. Nm51 TaxID=133720 RepID=UPI0008CCD1B3|nr:class I SAM-dependent methyltransferase [Nitrosomonas sp. Nm51]SEQ84082.1 Methyltransferase domain-containing protein [Nitrosomonas sp. Nm51]